MVTYGETKSWNAKAEFEVEEYGRELSSSEIKSMEYLIRVMIKDKFPHYPNYIRFAKKPNSRMCVPVGPAFPTQVFDRSEDYHYKRQKYNLVEGEAEPSLLNEAEPSSSLGGLVGCSPMSVIDLV